MWRDGADRKPGGRASGFPALTDARLDGNSFAMSITITLGKAGRLVVPKAIRDSLGLREGSRLKLEVQGGKIQAAPEADAVTIEMKGGFPVIQGGPPLKPGDIVRAIKADRESRDERALPSTRRKRG
jgi:AbrB family looped-hinge helix DNA binding protein